MGSYDTAHCHRCDHCIDLLNTGDGMMEAHQPHSVIVYLDDTDLELIKEKGGLNVITEEHIVNIVYKKSEQDGSRKKA